MIIPSSGARALMEVISVRVINWISQYTSRSKAIGWIPVLISVQKPNDWASFHDFWSAKLENFQQVGHFLTLLSNITHFLVKNCQKPNAWAKFTSQNLMPGQKLTPEIPNAQACTSIPTFIT